MMLMLLAAVVSSVTAETLIMAIMGVFGTLIVQGLKKYAANMNGTRALTVTVAISIALAFIGALLTGSFLDDTGATSYTSILNGIFTVFSVATLVYKYLLSSDASLNTWQIIKTSVVYKYDEI